MIIKTTHFLGDSFFQYNGYNFQLKVLFWETERYACLILY